MFIGIVKSNVVATVKHPAYIGRKLLLVRSLNPVSREIDGEEIIAVDFVDAGIGDTVLVSQEGSAARELLNNPKAPVRSFIIAIVEDWTVEEK